MLEVDRLGSCHKNKLPSAAPRAPLHPFRLPDRRPNPRHSALRRKEKGSFSWRFWTSEQTKTSTLALGRVCLRPVHPTSNHRRFLMVCIAKVERLITADILYQSNQSGYDSL